MIRRLNETFIAGVDEEVHWSDYFYFYGVFGGGVLFFLITAFIVVFT